MPPISNCACDKVAFPIFLLNILQFCVCVYCLTCKWAGQLACPDERGAGPGGVSRGAGGRRAPVGGPAAHAAAGGRGTRARHTAAPTVRPGSIALPNSKRTG